MRKALLLLQNIPQQYLILIVFLTFVTSTFEYQQTQYSPN